VSFSFASNSSLAVLVVTAIITCIVGAWAVSVRRGWPSIAVGLVLGGGLANTTERLVSPHHVVTDYLNVNNMFVCNLADVCLTVGVAIVLLMGLRGVSWR
jgi:signal peptidase II